MPSIDDVFESPSLKAADLDGKEPVVTIDTVEPKEFDTQQGKQRKLILTFVGKKKYLVCNVTNAKRIAHYYGTDYGKWSGKRIQLFTDLVEFQGKTTEAIRIRKPPSQSESQPEAKSKLVGYDPAEHDFDDHVDDIGDTF